MENFHVDCFNPGVSNFSKSLRELLAESHKTTLLSLV